MPSLPPLKRTILKHRPWYERYRKASIIGGTAIGLCIVFSKYIYNTFADIPYEFKVHPDVERERLQTRNASLDQLHKFLGADPEYVKQYRAQAKTQSDKLKELRDERIRMRQEIARLKALGAEAEK